MKVKASAGLLSGGLLALFVGGFGAAFHLTDQYGITTYPVSVLGMLIALLGLILLATGVYRLARNLDLATAKYVDGPEAVQKLTQPRDVRLREDTDV